MPKFAWEAKTRTGAVQKGVTEAQDAASVETQLKRAGMLGITVKEQKEGFKMPSFGGGSIDTKDLVIFTRQFATMIDSGLPLVQCLDILSSQQEKPAFKQILHLTSCSSTWWQPARSAVSWIPFSTVWRPTSKRR